MKKLTKKIVISTAVSSTLLLGLTLTTHAATNVKPLTVSNKTILKKQHIKLQQIMKDAKLGKTTTNHALDSIRLNTVKATLGKPVKEIEYKGSHILTYNAGKYQLFFEFPSLYSTSDNQPKNPKVTDYSIHASEKTIQQNKLQQIMKDAKLGKTTSNHALDSIRLNTVKATLGKPVKEIEYKGSHILTYNAGKYQLSFEFPSLYSTSDNQPKNPKVVDYSIYASAKTIQQTKLHQIMNDAKLGKTTSNHALDSIRLNTVKATLGKPVKEIEYKGSHILTYKAGKYQLSFEFPSLYSTSDSQPKNPKVIDYSIYK